MMSVKLFYVFCLVFLFSCALKAQEKIAYPDSLKGVVLKIEPLSFLYDHLSAGIEVPFAGNKFLDITLGYGGLGISGLERSNGFLFKGGIKFPTKFQTPFSILYIMPLFAYSNYSPDLINYPSNARISAQAILVDLGYRHINPQSKFYYDIGIDVGYGWANGPDATNNFNHVIIDNYDYMQPSVSGVALSVHFSIGILLKKKKK